MKQEKRHLQRITSQAGSFSNSIREQTKINLDVIKEFQQQLLNRKRMAILIVILLFQSWFFLFSSCRVNKIHLETTRYLERIVSTNQINDLAIRLNFLKSKDAWLGGSFFTSTTSRSNQIFPVFLIPLQIISSSISNQQSLKELFNGEYSFITIIWSLIWRIPWNSRFGQLFEWTPLLISIFWIFMWYIITNFIVMRAREVGQEEPESLVLDVSKFAQFFYIFCSIQAAF